MESARLSEFYRNMIAWPRSKSELSSAAERLGLLLEAPLAAVCVPETEEGERIAAKISSLNGNGLESLGQDLVEEMLKGQLKRIGPADPEAEIRQIRISQASAQLAAILPIAHLAIAPIPRPPVSDTAMGRLGPGQAEGRAQTPEHRQNGDATQYRVGAKRRTPGWLIIGTEKALSDRERILLIAAAQRLAGLAAIAQLEAAIHLRSQFLSIASHELKTPLTSIYGILQLQERMGRLKKEEPGQLQQDERKQSFLKIVIRQVERLNELIDGLLDVSRIQNGRFMVEPAETDVAAILHETVDSRLSLIAREAGVTLELEAPKNLIAYVDPVRVEEVITNLVMNATRFSPEGGVVWVRLRAEGGAFRLTVRDQGPSVPVEDRERIFQPFERAQRTSRLGGLGLGLFISRQIAQLHGGNVSLVESVSGKGNVFEAYFPGVEASREASANALPT